jgi:hypothetical protein
MWADINRLHSLSANAGANAVSKNQYPHMRVQIPVLGYANVVTNVILD